MHYCREARMNRIGDDLFHLPLERLAEIEQELVRQDKPDIFLIRRIRKIMRKRSFPECKL